MAIAQRARDAAPSEADLIEIGRSVLETRRQRHMRANAARRALAALIDANHWTDADVLAYGEDWNGGDSGFDDED